MKPKSSLRNFLALAGSSLLTVASASAQLYWDGNSTTAGAGNTTALLNRTWGTFAAWNSDSTGGAGGSFSTATSNTDNLYFVAGPSSTSGNVAYTVTVDGTQVANSLNFQAPAATTITGGTLITLGNGTAGSGGINMAQFAYGSTAQGSVTISTAIKLNNSQTWTNNSSNNDAALDVNAAIDLNGNDLTFDGSATTLDRAKANFTISNAITGTGNLIKNGTGVLWFDQSASATTWSGTTTVNGGVLRTSYAPGASNYISALPSGLITLNGGVVEAYWGDNFTRSLGDGTSANQIRLAGGASGFSMHGGNTLAITLNNDATTAIQWGSTHFNPSALVLGSIYSNGGLVDFNNRLDLNGTQRTIQVNQGSGYTNVRAQMDGVLSNTAGTAAGITKTGAGVLILTQTNTYDGSTIINGGGLRLTNASGLPGGIGATGGTSNLTMNGGYLEIATGTTFARNIGTGAAQFQITGGTSGFSAQGGARTVNIGGASATVTWGSAGFAPDVLVLNGGTANNTINFQNPLALGSSNRTVSTDANTATLSGNISSTTGGLIKTGAGQLNLNGDLTGLGGTLVLAAGTIGRASGNLVTSNIEVQSGTLSANVGGTTAVTKTTGGTVILSGANTYSGGFTLEAGLIDSIASGTYAGFGTGTLTLKGGSTLRVLAANTPTFDNDVSWETTSGILFTRPNGGSPTVTWAKEVTLKQNATIGHSGATNVNHIFNGNIVQDGTPRSLTFANGATGGASHLTLNGKNTFTGNLTHGAASNTTSSLTIGGSGYLGGGNYAGTISLGGRALFYSSSENQTLSGIITAGSLTKNTSSASTLTLSAGTHAISGAITVDAGTLAVTGSSSINSSSGVSITGGEFRYNSTTGLTRNVTVNGGTFRYNSSTDYSGNLTFTSGTLSGTNLTGAKFDNLTIGANQSISPGNSPGTMDVDNQTWGTGGSYIWEISDATGTVGAAPGWDLLAGTDTLTIGATSVDPFTILVTSLALDNLAGNAVNFNNGLNYAWIIADFTNPVSGFATNKFVVNSSAFSNVLNGAFEVAWGTGVSGGDDTQIYLTYTAVPEPGAALLGSLGLFLILRRRR
jgi:autotransporter-associated beta strand protein